MKKSLIQSQLLNKRNLDMYTRQLINLAQNVFVFENLDEFIDVSFLNSQLLAKGAIAFFYDDILNKMLALPFTILGALDVYGRPKKIQAFGQNGYTNKLKEGEFVIMYDNNGRFPLLPDVINYANKISNIDRTIDINVNQQKTNRYWTVPQNMERSVKDIINNIEGNNETILTYDDIDINQITATVQTSPYISDQLFDLKEKYFNEFLRLIGVANLSINKKERNIRDEITAMQGRYNCESIFKIRNKKKSSRRNKQKI